MSCLLLSPFLIECECSLIPETGLLFVNCSNRGFMSIPNDIPVNTAHLSLDGNVLNIIPRNVFKKLVKLTWLDLSNSHIYNLANGAFNNLTKLKVLQLKDNYLCENNGSYGSGVFSPLMDTLQELDISGNLKNIPKNESSYPSKALGTLHSLQVLKLDCISGTKLGYDFKNLHNLKELDFSQGIKASHIPDNMFQSIYGLNLKQLNLTNLDITKISGAVFSQLSSLRVLDLSNNPRLVTNAVDVAWGVRNTSIKELYMINTCLGFEDTVEPFLANLTGTNITVLALDQNEIHNIHNVFLRLPKIEILTLSNNGLPRYVAIFYRYFCCTLSEKIGPELSEIPITIFMF